MSNGNAVGVKQSRWQALRGGETSDAIKRIARSGPVLPEPLANAKLRGKFTVEDVPTSEALSAWLKARGVETSGWGSGNTKSVTKYWKEIDLQEAGLELWEKASGELQPVRVTHVLRAKVCSPSSYDHGVFLFNTWQQYGDGRKRVRNGLLSEKLTLDEMPLEDFLHEVCQRAVTEEEMQRVEDAVCTISADRAAPEFDPDYQCPLTVVDETYVDHTVEVETSKSYPGLLTLYHLYTVDIICEGLPVVDFNTLEFEHAEPGGKHPKLKYIHAWVWLEWSQIQRYLFEGSSLKERKTKGSFANAGELRTWLGQFALDLDVWGTGTYRSIEDLYTEVDQEQTQLELWGRHDGVPLLMRVVHVIQLKIASNDDRNEGKFLFQVWQQSKSGQVRSVNRLVSKKLQTSNLPFDKERFALAAKEAIHEQLTHFVDGSFSLSPDRAPSRNEYSDADISVLGVVFQGHHFDLEESPTYKGMHTMYHLYTMEVECEGLPLADFTTLDFKRIGGPYVTGWRWVNWQQSLDIVHERTQALEREDAQRRRRLKELSSTTLPRIAQLTAKLTEKVNDFEGDLSDENVESQELNQLIKQVQEQVEEAQGVGKQAHVSLAKSLPPAMVSKLAESAAVAEDTAMEPCLKESEGGQKALVTARSVTFDRRHSALADPNLAQFRDKVPEPHREAAEATLKLPDSVYKRGSGVLPVVGAVVNRRGSSSSAIRRSISSPSSPQEEKRRLSGEKRNSTGRRSSVGSDPEVTHASLNPDDDAPVDAGLVRSLSLPVPEFDGDEEYLPSPMLSRRDSMVDDNDLSSLQKSLEKTEELKEDEGRQRQAFKQGSAVDALPLDVEVSVPSKMREAAKAAFAQSGIDTAGLLEKDVLVRIIGQICGNEPEYAAHVQAMIDMVCPPQDSQGKVSCAAFIDYVFAD